MSDPLAISRVTRRKTEFRDRITAAALKLFAEHGVADTSIAAIIKEADIAHKTFFNHFPTKDHLLQHIVSSHSEHAYRLFRDTFNQHSDPRKQLQFCLVAIASQLASMNPAHYRELLTFYFISSASTRDFREQQKHQFAELVTQILQLAHDRRQLRTQFSIETLTEIVVGICVATLLNWCVAEDYPIVARMKQAAEFINASVFIEESP